MPKNSGKSKSNENPNGVRRKFQGKELAPRSLRKYGKRIFLEDCNSKDLEKLSLS